MFLVKIFMFVHFYFFTLISDQRTTQILVNIQTSIDYQRQFSKNSKLDSTFATSTKRLPDRSMIKCLHLNCSPWDGFAPSLGVKEVAKITKKESRIRSKRTEF